MSFATALQGISPFGPIFGKELRTTARRKRTYALRVIYLSLLLLVLLWAYAVTSEMNRYGGIAAQNQERARLGQIFFATFGIFSVFMMGLFGPVMTATAISSERLHKTLPVLLMTPITAWQIIAGKLFSRLLVSITLIGLGLPVLALVRLLGGVELEQVIGVVVLALLAAFSSAAIGLFYSTLLNRAYAVILLSFGTMLFLYLFVPFIMALSSRQFSHQARQIETLQIVCAINPYFMVFPTAVPDVWGRIGIALPWTWCIASHLIFPAFLMTWSAMILRRRARREGEASGGAVDPTLGVPFAAAAPPPPLPMPLPTAPPGDMPALAPPPPLPMSYASPRVAGGKKYRSARTVGDNPILWREIGRPLLARRWQRIVASIVCLLLLTIVYTLLGLDDDLKEHAVQGGWACIFNFLVSGVVLVISSTAIAQEKESDTWTLLLATPVSGRTIVWGKAVGTARRMLWPMLLISAHFLVFAVFQVISLTAALMAIWIIISFNSIWIATGIYFSLRFRKTTSAVVANLLLAIAAYVIVFGVLTLAAEIDYRRHRYTAPEFDSTAINLTITLIFLTSAGWLAFTLFRAMSRPRGALGTLMVSMLIFITASLVFAAKMSWISQGDIAEQVGWYVPYYYLAQIGERGFHSIDFRLPGQRGQSTTIAACGIVFATGLAYVLLSQAVLSMTAWKFSAIVGRARQARRLSANESPPARPISTPSA